MKYAAAIFAILIVLLVLDILWIKFVMGDVFRATLGETALQTPRLFAASLFYALYVGGIFFLIVQPSTSSTWTHTMLTAALLGLMAYGTYDLTNMATLKPWSWKLVGIDMAWGTIVTTLSALAGRRAMEWVR